MPENCNLGYGCGTVFSLNPTNGVEAVKYSFKDGTDGAFPNADLISFHGTLYGTTPQGGNEQSCANLDYGCGTVFSIDVATGAETVVHTFQGDADGAEPLAGLTKFGGRFYGTTDFGGSAGAGAIFALNRATGTEKVVYSFQVTPSDGSGPGASLINVGGTLYGTTSTGGDSGNGTVFAFDPKTSTEKVLHSFAARGDGAIPDAALTYIAGTLYGTTSQGGSTKMCNTGYGCGTVFAYTP
jgi:uncharacterized repeat protein (TIGR03803 family)